MTDIKIEKTAGGYKATVTASTVYESADGVEWGHEGCGVVGDRFRTALIQQYIDPPDRLNVIGFEGMKPKSTEPEAPAPFKKGDEVVCDRNYSWFLREGITYIVCGISGDEVLVHRVGDGVADSQEYQSSRFTHAPAPAPFKVGDRVVCVDAGVQSWLEEGKTYTVTKAYLGYVYVDGNPASFVSRFAHAPAPKVYTGDPKEWEPGNGGVFRELKSDIPYLLFVDSGGYWVAVYEGNGDYSPTDYIVRQNKTTRFHRIADSISDIIKPGIMDMEGMV